MDNLISIFRKAQLLAQSPEYAEMTVDQIYVGLLLTSKKNRSAREFRPDMPTDEQLSALRARNGGMKFTASEVFQILTGRKAITAEAMAMAEMLRDQGAVMYRSNGRNVYTL